MGFAISPKELKARLDKGDKLVLVDVREEWEYSLAKLDGSILIPLGTTPSIARSVEPRLRDHCHLPPWHEKRRCDKFLASTGIPECEELGGGNRRLVDPGGWNRPSILTQPYQCPWHTCSTLSA